MSGPVRTLIVYPGPKCLGGISRVVHNLHGTEFWRRWDCRGYGTYSESPSALVRAAVSAWRIALFPFALIASGARLVIVHTSSGGSFVRKSAYARIASALGRKVIVHVHPSHFQNYYESDSKRQSRIDAVLNRAEVILFTNHGIRDYFAKRLGEQRCHHLPNPVDVEVFASARRRTFTGNRRLLYMGWIIPEKGVFDLLAAMPKVLERFPDATLDYAGNKQVELLRRRVQEARLSDSVNVLGWVAGDDRLELFRRSRALVLPSYSEGLPNVLLEAMASALPVVTTPVGGIPEAFEHERNGLFVEPRDVARIADALIRLLEDDDLCERISRQTLDSIIGTYDADAVAARLDRLCEQALS